MSFDNRFGFDEQEYDPSYRWEDYEDMIGYLMDEWFDSFNRNRKRRTEEQ